MVIFFFFFFISPEYNFDAQSEEFSNSDKCTDQDYAEIFIERLKTARQNHAHIKTQRQLAEAIGVSANSLCNYEKGLMPSLANTLKLADALGVSLDYLFARGCYSGSHVEPSLGTIARNIITLSNQQGMHLISNGNPTLTVEHDRLRRFLIEYIDYSNALKENPNNTAMRKMFESWYDSQLRELDQISLK